MKLGKQTCGKALCSANTNLYSATPLFQINSSFLIYSEYIQYNISHLAYKGLK